MNGELSAAKGKVVASAVGAALARAIRDQPEEVVSRFAQCLEELLVGSSSEVEGLEIRRRVAEAQVSVLFEKEDIGLFLVQWGELESLGYSDPAIEASMLFYFLEFSARTSQSAEVWQPKLVRMEAVTRGLDPKVTAHFDEVISRLRVKLSNTGSP